MKKKYSYLFEKKVLKAQVLCEPDAVGFLLNELKGKSLPEQLYTRGIRLVTIDNKVSGYGRIDSLHASKAKKFFSSIPGFRAEDLPPGKDNFFVAVSIRQHRQRKKKTIDWREMCETLGHEIGHTWQCDSRNPGREKFVLRARLSCFMNYEADEDFCNDFGEAWLTQDDNYNEAKAFLMAHHRHGDQSWVRNSFVMTFTAR